MIGLDWGEARVGVAVSDPLDISSQPLTALKNDEKLISGLKDIVTKYSAEKIVVGLPRSLNGSLGSSAEKVKVFGEMIEKELGIKPILWDERLTTKLAQQTLRSAGVKAIDQKSLIDASAAALMLQSYMDSVAHEKKN